MVSYKILAVVALAVSLSGCIFQRKSNAARLPPPAPKPAAAAPAKPEGPLSLPQTTVKLPPPQPLDPAALEVEPPPLVEPQEATLPVKPPRRNPPAAGTAVKPPETAAPAPQPATPEERPRLQEIISAEERKRLLEEIGNRKREINEVVDSAARRNLSQQDRDRIDRIRSFVELSDQAAGRGDMRQADALSERALLLARELRGAR
jgi:hypothetical protein